jgi:hypothetical protein
MIGGQKREMKRRCENDLTTPKAEDTQFSAGHGGQVIYGTDESVQKGWQGTPLHSLIGRTNRQTAECVSC